MKSLAVLYAMIAFTLVVACGATQPPVAVPPVTSAMPGPSTPPLASSGEAPSPSASAYTGHGAGTIGSELLEKYRPRPLPPDVARRIESLMDVRAPGIGRLGPDGKAMYFSWTITGVGQVWKLDGPRRFPEQLTGGEDNTWLASVTPDGRTLVLQRDRKGEENPGLYLQPAGGGPLVSIQHVPGVQTHYEAVSSDSRYVYFTSNDRKPDAYVVYRFDLQTGHVIAALMRRMHEAKAGKASPTDLGGIDALVNAASAGDIAAVEALLAKGIDVAALSRHGESALGRAAAKGRVEMIRALVAKGANPSAGNSRGITPLIFAAFEGQTEAARALLSAGADPNGVTGGGATALKVAVDLRHHEIEQLLRKAGAVK